MQIEEIIETINNLSAKYDELDKKSANYDRLEAAISRPAHLITSEAEEYFDPDFDSYVRKGNSTGLEFKSMNSINGEEGGFLVSSSVYRMVSSALDNLSIMRKLASVEKISGNSLDLIEESGNMSSGWVLETSNREVTENKTFSKRTINTNEMYAQPKATQKLLDDSSINIEKWLSEKIAESFANLESVAFFSGKGNDMPRGILTYDHSDIQTLKTSSDKTISYDNIMDLVHSLPFEYRQRASFIAHPQTICELMKIKEKSSGRYLWNPSLESDKPSMLFGLPIFEDRNMPQIASEKIVIILADFKKAYKIVDRTGIQILRDPYTDKPFVKFYATKRVGGDVVDKNAMKYLVC